MPPKPKHIETNSTTPTNLIELKSSDNEWSNWPSIDRNDSWLYLCTNCKMIIPCKKTNGALRAAKNRAREFHCKTAIVRKSPGIHQPAEDQAIRQDGTPSQLNEHCQQTDSLSPNDGAAPAPLGGLGSLEQSVGAASSCTLQNSVTQARTVGEKRDQRDASEVVMMKSKEYYPDGTLKCEVEASKQTTDKGETVSRETKELQTQVLQLQQELTVNQMKVERTFNNRLQTAIKRGIAARVEGEKRARQTQVNQQVATQCLSAKDAQPLDVYLLAKLVELYSAFISETEDNGAFAAWLAERKEDAFAHVQGLFESQRYYNELVSMADEESEDLFRDKMPLLSNLGFTISKLKELGLWPRAVIHDEEGTASEEYEAEEGHVEDTIDGPSEDCGRYPSPIDHLPKEGWTSKVLKECLEYTGTAMNTRPIDPLSCEPKRQDPPELLEIIDQHVRTEVYYKPGDSKKVIHNRKILELVVHFKHPTGGAVEVQVDKIDLDMTYNRPHYSAKLCSFFSKHPPLSTR